MRNAYTWLLELILTISLLLTKIECFYSVHSANYSGYIECISPDTSFACFLKGDERNIYISNGTGYSYLYTIGLYDSAYAMSRVLMLNSPNIIILSEHKVSAGSCYRTIRVFNYSADSLTLVQTITPFITPENAGDLQLYLYGSHQAILAASTQTTTIFRWDTTLGRYSQAGPTSTFSSVKNQRARAISLSGKYYAQESSLFATTLQLYVYSAGAYSVCDTVDFTPLPTSDIRQVILYDDNAGNSFMMVAIGAVNNQLKVYKFGISGTDSLSLTIQTVAMSNAPNLYYLSSKGNYFLAGTANPHSISVYHFNTTTVPNSYTLTLNKQLLPYYPSPDFNTNFIKDDKSYFYYRLNTNTTMVNSLYVYFQCTVAHCADCLFFGYCRKCVDGFQLSGGICVCPAGKSFVSNTCISCTLAHCASSTAPEICSACTNGYSLSNNLCTCSNNKTISLLTGNCVTCNITDCGRCDQPNVCSQISTQSQLDKMQSMIVFVVVALALVIAVIVGGFVYLIMKIKQAQISPQTEPNLASLNQTDMKNNTGSTPNMPNNTDNMNSTALKQQSSQTKIRIQDELLVDDISYVSNKILQQSKPPRRKKPRRERELQSEAIVMDELPDNQNSVNYRQEDV